MDFNLDDPLGDLLSDGSNDSFFETTSKRKSSAANTKQSTKVTSTPAKGKMEDLFGIKEPAQNTPRIVEPETRPITTNTEPALVKKTIEPARPKNPPVVKADSVFNDDDIISDLGFDPKKPKGGSKSNILDDILGPVEPPKKTQALTPARPVTAGVLQRDESKVISRQSTETTESTVPGTYTASLNKPKTAGRRQSMASGNDPLGLFGSSSNKDKESVEAKEIKETPKIKRKGTTADWLGLDPEPKPQKEAPARSESPAITQKQNQPQILIIPEQQQQQLPPSAGYSFQIPPTPNVTQNAMLMAASTFETQNALQALKQQEAQMIATTQVKHQEAALLEMQKRQQELLEHQESQFNELLQKQLVRQNQLEMTIRAQQERINAHIQLMMTHPGMHLNAGDMREEAPKRTKMEKSDNVDGEEIEIDEIQLQADVKRLQLEKLRLEDLISNINANHEKEIEFMENSHKKQIQVLEHNLQAIEGRLQTEIKSIEEFYSKKLDQIITEKATTISSYDQKIKDIEEYYENSIKKLKSNYDNDIESIKEDHKRMIENIRQSKMLEFAVVQENSSYIDTLRSASNHLETVSGDLQTLKEEMYHKIDIAHKERQMKLELREKKLEDAERRLKITEETSEQEKARLMELVTTLEVQLSKLSKGTAEEQWILRQKLSSLEAERTSFEREKELNREQILRDERRVEELKQFQLNENQRLMQQIQDERQVLAAEKTKFETVKKLHATEMIHTPQVEVETALKVAQDASRQADQERERYFKMQRQLEAKKRELIDQENNIRQKQDELESAIVSTKAKERRIQDALKRNRLIEQNFTTKVQMLQSQMRQIAQRETQLSQERIILSKERLDLQDLKRKLELNKCSLCKIGERSAEISQFLTREENPTESEQQLPPDFMTYNVNNLLHSNIDNLFDDGIAESLKKLDGSNFKVNLAADLDITGTNEEIIQNPVNGSSPVPSHFIDSEILLLNFDIKRNFLDE